VAKLQDDDLERGAAGLKWYYEREKPGAALVEWNQS
jgi:hypothetical protein